MIEKPKTTKGYTVECQVSVGGQPPIPRAAPALTPQPTASALGFLGFHPYKCKVFILPLIFTQKVASHTYHLLLFT